MTAEQAKPLEEELLALLASQVRHAPLTLVFSLGVIAYMIAGHRPDLLWLLAIWIAVEVLAQVIRIRLLARLPRMNQVTARTRLRYAAAMNATNVGLHSLSLLAFPLLTPFEASVQSMIFLGMGVASIITALGYPPFVITHLLLSLAPTFTLWFWSGIRGPGGETALLVAAVGTAYCITLYFISRRLFALATEYFLTRARINQALEQAEQAGRTKTRFLAAASHDLRQPIHTLVMLCASLGMQKLDDRSRQISARIDQALKSLAGQLDALLDVSRLDAGVIVASPAVFSLSDLLQDLQAECTPPALERDITIEVACPEGAMVLTDRLLLERVLRNLVSNAIRHNSGCRVRLEAANTTEGAWELCLEDDGKGIPEEEQARIFEEFYQIHNPERDRSKGLGLGLSIVSRLERLLGLDMRFESAPGIGTRFRFTLPGAPPAREAVAPAPDLPAVRPLHVLVVDDEAAVRDSMRLLLQSLGHTAVTASDIAAALAAVDGRPADLALVDFRLRANESGLDLIQRLRATQPDLPAIQVSGDTAPERLREVAAAGLPLLSKPVPLESLQAAIFEAVNGSSGAASRP